jgi:hypothetical protein
MTVAWMVIHATAPRPELLRAQAVDVRSGRVGAAAAFAGSLGLAFCQALRTRCVRE